MDEKSAGRSTTYSTLTRSFGFHARQKTPLATQLKIVSMQEISI